MRHADWKKLLEDPVVVKAREALRMAKEALLSDPAWKPNLTRLTIFPDASRKKGLLLLVADLASTLPGQTPQVRREIAWETMANASPEEAKAIVLAEIRKFPSPLVS